MTWHTLTETIIIHCIFIHTDDTAQQENHRSTLKIWQRRITSKGTPHVVLFEKRKARWMGYLCKTGTQTGKKTTLAVPI